MLSPASAMGSNLGDAYRTPNSKITGAESNPVQIKLTKNQHKG